jgi:hypothetical protein
MLKIHVGGTVETIALDRVVNAGYSGRDEDDVQAHIDELVEDGIDAPERVPTTYELAPNIVLTGPSSIQVVGPDTSGEAEFGLLVTDEETYVVAASDQTDRNLERQNIQKAKQIAPNVISRRAWRLSEVRNRWDDIEIRAWNTVDGERRLYQETTLAAIREPEELLELVEERYGTPLAGTAVLSGTVATVEGELAPGSMFEVELLDPETDRTLSVTYDVEPM